MIEKEITQAICRGNLDRIYELDLSGIDVTKQKFLNASIKHEQLLVVCHQVHKGANIEIVLNLAEEYGASTIWRWARCWKFNHSNTGGKV